MQRLLLDFSNIRVGGALLVASATLADAARPDMQAQYKWLKNADFWISPMVRRNLSLAEADLPGGVTFKETAATARALFRRPRRHFDVRFTLFGPTYTGRLAHREITGFADTTLLVPSQNIGLARPKEWLRSLGSRFVKRNLMMRSDVYVTETSAVADLLSARYGIARAKIQVVANRPHHIFTSQEPVPPRPQGVAPGALHLAYPARGYPHKNLRIIEPAGARFHEQTGKKLIVHTTLRDDEWAAMPAGARQWMINHGEASAQQVLEIYRQIDGVFFPSLLEASSVTPLEANVLGIPLLASDRDFVRMSAEATVLFEPTDPASVAAALVEFDADRDRFWRQARSAAIEYRQRLGASSRSQEYFALIDRQMAGGRVA